MIAASLVVASAVPTHGRTLVWAGREWTVHASSEPVGAGPNRWSDAWEAVHVDEGELVLALTRDASGWLGVELSTELEERPRQLDVELSVGRLDSQVVAGIFLYRDDTSEIDLEVARWGDPTALPFQYAIAPANEASLLHRFSLAEARSRHRLRWRNRTVVWRSWSGTHVEHWRFRGDAVPAFDGHRLHLNLWVLRGGAPAGDGESTVRIGMIRLHP